MDRIKNRVKKYFADNQLDMKWCFLFTYLWGIAAHGYIFLNNSISHDSLDEFVLSSEMAVGRRYANGRVFWLMYRSLLQMDKVYPWLIGLLSLLYIGIAVFLVIRIFKVKSKPLMFLISGIMTVNITVVATAATFLHDFDCDMFALLLSVAAVSLWKEHRWGYLWGSIPVMVMLGLYQGYITVTITLAMFVCILMLLDGASFQQVFFSGIKAIGMIIIGGILYFIAMKGILVITHRTLSDLYNSPAKLLEITPASLLPMVKDTYFNTLKLLMRPATVYPYGFIRFINGAIYLTGFLTVARHVWIRKLGVPEALLLFTLILLLPLGMNIVAVLSGGVSQELMYYALFLVFPFIIVVIDRYANGLTIPGISEHPLQTICFLLLGVLLWGNLMFAHEAYLVKDFEQDALLSYMTRVAYRIEEEPDYIQGGTPIAFIGYPEHVITLMPDANQVYEVNGMYYPYPWYCGTADKYVYYYRYILMNPAVIATDDIVLPLAQNPEVIAMPSYPEEGCMQFINDVLVVKLGN